MFDTDSREKIFRIAAELCVQPAALMAIVEVESGGRLYAKVQERKEPLIRFEGHYFDRLLPATVRQKARKLGLASPKAGKIRNPARQSERWKLLNRAIEINRIAALSSCSWGVGQVMGAHWKWLGFGSIDALVAQARSGGAGQVALMARYVEKAGLVTALQEQDWATFARLYNGPAYAKYAYDKKMATAFERYHSSSVEWEVMKPAVPVVETAKPKSPSKTGARKPSALGAIATHLLSIFKRFA
jgi:hypothetical protein